MSVRILIADDHVLIRRGIKDLLESRGWILCGEAETGRDAVEKAQKLKPDIVVLDIGMPELNGIDAARIIKKSCPHTEILVLSVHYSVEIIRQVAEVGVRGYVIKSDSDRDLEKAIEALAAHKPFFAPLATDAVLNNLANENGDAEPKEQHRLSSREREVLQMLVEGRSSKKVAIALGISPKTAETHRANLMRKLGIKKIANLVRYAARHYITEP